MRPVVEEEDLIGARRIEDRRCAITITTRVARRLVQGGDDARLGLRIERRGRLVEDQDPGVAHAARARSRAAASVRPRACRPRVRAASGSPRAARARIRRLRALRAARSISASARVGPPEPQVLLDARVEERGLLEHERDPRAQRRARQRSRRRRRRRRRGRRSARGSAAAATRASSCRCPRGRRAP